MIDTTANMFKFMVRSKISGIVISRHKSEELALKSLRKNNTGRSPLYIQEYIESIYREYVKPARFISEKKLKG